MASFNEMALISIDAGFLRRVTYCLKKAAVAVMAEDVGTANHAERVTYSIKVLDGTASVTECAKAIVTNATLTSGANPAVLPDFNISDGDLEFTVNSMFNAFAGVST